jgi:hypothetical protein
MEWNTLAWLKAEEVTSIVTKWEEFIEYLSNCQLAKMDFVAESE